MKYIFAVLLLLSVAQATEFDDYYGKYQSVGDRHPVAFTFARTAVSDLVVDGIHIKDGVTYDILGIFEGSLLLRIDYIDSNRRQCVIRVLILNEKKKFIVSSGFHVSFRLDADNQPEDMRTFTFELRRH